MEIKLPALITSLTNGKFLEAYTGQEPDMFYTLHRSFTPTRGCLYDLIWVYLVEDGQWAAANYYSSRTNYEMYATIQREAFKPLPIRTYVWR